MMIYFGVSTLASRRPTRIPLERLQSALDSAWPRLRLGTTVRDHGFLVLFHAACLVAVLLVQADLTLHDFSRRVIGQATVEGVSVAARTGLYARSLLVFLVALPSLAWIARKLERLLGSKTLALLNLTSFVGCLLLYLTCWRLLAPGGFALLVAVEGLIVAIALLDRFVLKREVHPDGGRYLVWLVALGLALVFPLYDVAHVRLKALGSPGLVVAATIFAIGLSVHVALSLTRASDRWLHASMPLAALPLVSVLRNEIHLCFNERGLYAVRPEYVQIVLGALILGWCLARFLRRPKSADQAGRLDLERLLGLGILPWLLVGIASFNGWWFVLTPSPDFLEPANPGLFIQQWFDFGRVPFFDTFNGHGLSDSFFGFLYCLVHGSDVLSWQYYDFLADVVVLFGIYHLFRRVMGNACGAFFSVLFLPYLEELFPPFCAMAILVVFLVHWVSTQRTARAWALFFAGLLFAFAWRLDIGFAATLAAVPTLLLVRAVTPGYRLPTSAILRGCGLAAAICGSAFVAICVRRGISPLTLLVDYQHMTSSNQGFGYTHIAGDMNPLVLWHLFVIPLLVLSAAAWLVVRSRGRLAPQSREYFVFTAGIFLSAYVFTNFPRGLVRHSFLEPGITMIASFAFPVLGLAAYWTIGEGRPRSAFAAFVLITSLFSFNLGLNHKRGDRIPPTGNAYERAMERLVSIARPEGTDQRIERLQFLGWFSRNHLEEIKPFIESSLEPGQTFLDLSNSPMLYYYTHKRSPQFANHLMLVHDEYTQKRVLEDLEHEDLPFVTLVTEADRCKQANVACLAAIDDVPCELRQYRLHEWVYEHYEPYALIQRWQVWIRKGWLAPKAPAGTDRQVEFAWQADPPSESPGPTAAADGATSVRLGQLITRNLPTVELSPELTRYLRIEGRAERPSTLKLAWTTRSSAGVRHFERQLSFPAGAQARFFVLPGERDASTLEKLELDWEGAFELQRCALVRSKAEGCIEISKRADLGRAVELGHLARLWGEELAHAPALKRLATLPVEAWANVPESNRCSFEPITDRSRGNYLLVRARVPPRPEAKIVVDYGEGQENLGRFVFEGIADGEPHDYAVRLSIQYNWYQRACDWISFASDNGPIEILSAAVTEGD